MRSTDRSALRIVMDTALGGFRFEWRPLGSEQPIAVGELSPNPLSELRKLPLRWEFVQDQVREFDVCRRPAAAVRAMLKRILKRLPLAPESDPPQFGFRLHAELGRFQAGRFYGLIWPDRAEWRGFLARAVLNFVTLLDFVAVEAGSSGSSPPQAGGAAMICLLRDSMGLALEPSNLDAKASAKAQYLCITREMVQGFIQFDWSNGHSKALAEGRVWSDIPNKLSWRLTVDGVTETAISKSDRKNIRAQVERWTARFPVEDHRISSRSVLLLEGTFTPQVMEDPAFRPDESPWSWIEANILAMAQSARTRFPSPGSDFHDFDPERYEQRLLRKHQRRIEEEQRRQETMERLAAERQIREQRLRERAAEGARTKPAPSRARTTPSSRNPPERPVQPLPPVPLRLEMPPLAIQGAAIPLTNLRSWRLTEQAARWWVSNQSDDLLALPYCRIQKLDYQVRSALRILGALRGRALLSDEVGLGKTIEAGLVLKEWITRGMVRRFLVLTVPSLVDQWEEELNDKFGLTVATTNHPASRGSGESFWRDSPGIVASLHTLKQPAHLEIARSVHWDLVIVDEAHYLRNRESQAWQAVNSLPRQFLLLLTATPVQNSIEELYNLVTLLQPGQLPTPKEFRARFVDPKRPRQPREPEELRRLLGQVMIRNIRANAGVNLPPRRAETVIFETQPDEREFWTAWEIELRTELAQLPAGQASLWGRLLLQAVGSSPAAWRGALEKFPNHAAARTWRERAPLESSWKHKCNLLPPLTRTEGGLVVFTQFLDTQAALAGSLRDAGVETFVINGATPAAERQPITEQFRKMGGALLLTHSGTEGRNLQFCHRLVNFDLPWNPMEIEQRIGRLHRLGQQHPVRIYNLVQAGTLQEHLLQILQEKLNLFELVVGETGLVLGERFGSEEFAEEVLRRWRDSEGRVAEAMESLGVELAAARDDYQQVKALDETLFAKDYETL